MTSGALIFAFNNEATDFVTMADWSASRIRRYLGLPTAIVTDNADFAKHCKHIDQIIVSQPESGGSRWFEDYDQTVTWHNAARTDALALTPWDHTLVLDADYVVNSADLNAVMSIDTDFISFGRAYNIAVPDQEFMPSFGRTKLPMFWATVMAFRKSNTADWIFQSMDMIKTNWQHYRDLYGIGENNYRNDYALSIALALVNGSTPHVQAIPWSMATVLPAHRLSMLELDGIEIWNVEYQNQNQHRMLGITGVDLHAMGKRDLGDIIAGRTRLSDNSH